MGFSSFLCGSTIILQFTSDHSAEFIQTLWEALAYSVQLLRTQPPPHPNSLHTTTLLLRMWPLKTAWTFALRSKMALCRSFAVDQSLPLSAPPSLRRWVSHIIVFGLKRNTHTHTKKKKKKKKKTEIASRERYLHGHCHVIPNWRHHNNSKQNKKRRREKKRSILFYAQPPATGTWKDCWFGGAEQS